MRIILLTAFAALSALAQNRAAVAARPVVSSHPAAIVRQTPSTPAPTRTRPAPVRTGPSPARPSNPIRTNKGYQRNLYVPYPVYVGGGYAPSNNYQEPVAVVNPNFVPDGVNPQIIDFSNAPIAAPSAVEPDAIDEPILRDDQPTIFLIALTDHTILPAISYWVDDDTLNWITRDAKTNRLSLSLVDRDFSKQLNDERHVEFKLPPVK
jgi:hypothetical protein